jgi:hypothetical protein
VHSFELRPVLGGFELRGGQLTEPMVFREEEPRPAVHLAGFFPKKRAENYGSSMQRGTWSEYGATSP